MHTVPQDGEWHEIKAHAGSLSVGAGDNVTISVPAGVTVAWSDSSAAHSARRSGRFWVPSGARTLALWHKVGNGSILQPDGRVAAIIPKGYPDILLVPVPDGMDGQWCTASVVVGTITMLNVPDVQFSI